MMATIYMLHCNITLFVEAHVDNILVQNCVCYQIPVCRHDCYMLHDGIILSFYRHVGEILVKNRLLPKSIWFLVFGFLDLSVKIWF